MDHSRVDNEHDRRAVRRVARCAVGVALALMLAGLAGAPPARAGTYVMRNCDVPGHASAALGPWQITVVPANMVVVDQCASGGGIGFAFTGARRLSANTGVVLKLLGSKVGPSSSIRLVKSVLHYAARLAGEGPPISVFAIDYHSDGAYYPTFPITPPGAENLVLEQLLTPARTNEYGIGISCSPGLPERPDCVPAHNTPLLIRGMEVTLSEDVAPVASQPGGALLGEGPQAGVRSVTYAASDPQSGLARIEVLLGDTVVGSRDLTLQCPHGDFTICPASADGSLEIDTRAVPNGPHRLTLRVTDAAGNRESKQAPNAVDVANHATISERLTARFSGSSRSTMTVAFGRRVRISGRLTATAGRGIGRARIQVFERNARTAARQRAVGSVLTRPDGTFSYLLARARPSRSVRLVGPSASRTLHLRVRAAASLKASLRGTVVRFGGRVVSGPLPSSGKRVVLQGRAPGYTWATFATTRTNRVGRFSGRYRLPVRRPGVRLQIRVVVPAEKTYPYASYSGGPITLRVR